MAPTNLFFDTLPGAVGVEGLQPGSVTGDVIDANTITGSNITGGTITGDLIAAGTISGDKIQAGSITADKLNVTQLSAITANMGTLTAGTITGGTFQTAAANPRLVLDPTGLKATSPAGVTTFQIDAATGNVTATGGTFTGASFVGGSFSGVTFTGGIFQTGPSNPRVWFDTAGIHATNAAGAELVRIDAATGKLTATNADFTGGTITGGTFIGSVFETSATNPKVRIDATGIRMTATDGTTTFYADSSTGVLTLGNPAGSKITFDPALATMQRLYLEGRLVGTGTIMGPSFETGLNNPRIVIDQFGIRAYPPGTFPSASLKDDFNRANVGPPPSGAWLADFRGGGGTAFKIVSNRAVPSFAPGTGGDNESCMYWNVLTTTSDHEVFCDIAVEADVELWARISWTAPGGVTAYVCYYSAADHSLRVQRYGPGGPGWYTDISDVVYVGFTAGMSIGIRVVGQSVTLFHKAAGAPLYSQVLQVSDPDPPHPEFTAGDKWGVLAWEMGTGTGASPLAIDNIGGGDYVPVGGGTPTFSVDTGTGAMTVQGGSITAGLIQTDDEDPRVVMDNYRDAGGVMRGRFRATDATGTVRFLIQDGVVTNTGGTIRSSATNPKVELGPAGLFSYDAGANVMFKADPADGGKATLFNGNLTGTTRNTGILEHRLIAPGSTKPLSWTISGTEVANLQFDDTGLVHNWAKNRWQVSVTGTAPAHGSTSEVAPYGRFYATGTLVQGLVQEAAGNQSYLNLQNSTVILQQSISAGPAAGSRRVILDQNGAQLFSDVSVPLGIRAWHSAAAVNYWSVASSGKIRFGEGSGGATQPIDFVNGWVVAYGGTMGSGQAFNHEAGHKAWLAAASQSVGGYVGTRCWRTDAAGATVTPASATVGTPFLQANNNSQLANTLRPGGFQFTFVNTAAGQAYCYANVLVS